jgi:hypothetical protein
MRERRDRLPRPDVGAPEHVLEQRLERRAVLAAADRDLDDPLQRPLFSRAIRSRTLDRSSRSAIRSWLIARSSVSARSALAPHLVHPSPHRRQLLEASVQLLARRRALAVLVLAHDERVVLVLLARVDLLHRVRLDRDRLLRRGHLLAHPRRAASIAPAARCTAACIRPNASPHAPRSRSPSTLRASRWSASLPPLDRPPRRAELLRHLGQRPPLAPARDLPLLRRLRPRRHAGSATASVIASSAPSPTAAPPRASRSRPAPRRASRCARS